MAGRLLVGLTGGLAAGKSTVARLLAERDCTVVDADQLVAELYAPGGKGASAIATIAGPEALKPDGRVDHAALARLIFGDAVRRRQVEAAIHPLVREAFQARAKDLTGIVVLEATLLVEAGFAVDFDILVTVEADPALRLERAIARGLSAEDAQRRLAAQSAEETRTSVADIVLRNDGSPAALELQVDQLIQGLRAGLAPPGGGG